MTPTDQDTLFDLEPLTEERYVGRCPVRRCTTVRAASTLEPLGCPDPARCDDHGRRLRWNKVEGTYRSGIRCDARCQFAVGPLCVCSCGGANHSAGWMP